MRQRFGGGGQQDLARPRQRHQAPRQRLRKTFDLQRLGAQLHCVEAVLPQQHLADMQARSGLSMACLQKDLSQRRITHDSYFHSVLGLMNVQTSVYRPELDIYQGCKPRQS